MFSKNSYYTGMLYGLVAPAISFFVAELFRFDIPFGDKPYAIYLLAAVTNLFLLRHQAQSGRMKTAEGLMISLFFSACLFYIFKVRE